MTNMSINKLPSPTWNWLNVNKVDLENVEFTSSNEAIIDVPSEIEFEKVNVSSDIKTGSGDDVDKISSIFETYKFTAYDKVTKPVYIDFNYKSDEKSFDSIYLEAKDNSEMTVIIRFLSESKNEGFSAVQIKSKLGKNATINLINIDNLGKNYNIINDIGTLSDEKSMFNLTQLFLSGKNTYIGTRVDLNGKESEYNSNIGYIVDDGKLDMNYISNHIAKKTNCDINVAGVMRKGSSKVFRGTIDFKEGASESIGSEKEDVLLMDDDVRNQTIPVILCHEEDVEGSHGATIGKLDDDILFYMQSRGISQDAVYELMAKARIKAVSDTISDIKTRKYIESCLGGVIE